MSLSVTTSTTSAFADYFELCKPKVVVLIVFTAVVGMFLAVPGMVPWDSLIFGTLGIGLAASSAAAINHVVDQKVDAQMGRTSARPLPTGHLNSRQALVFAISLGVISMAIRIGDVGRRNCRSFGRHRDLSVTAGPIRTTQSGV